MTVVAVLGKDDEPQAPVGIAGRNCNGDLFVKRRLIEFGYSDQGAGDSDVIEGAPGIFSARDAGAVGVVGQDGIEGRAFGGGGREREMDAVAGPLKGR